MKIIFTQALDEVARHAGTQVDRAARLRVAVEHEVQRVALHLERGGDAVGLAKIDAVIVEPVVSGP